uniref:Uncharacterized protein n=1 Tax=Tanacetum cinerariifolium TaxID=118510 RepID=A0A699HKP0_TANCI|nr:hypothetical protein [Tanacetum cinerariifolium]
MRIRSPDRLLSFLSGFPFGMVPPKNLDERNSLVSHDSILTIQNSLRSVPAALSRSVPAVLARSVPAVLARSVPAVLARSVPAVLARSVPAVLARSVPAVLARSVPTKILDRLTSKFRSVSFKLLDRDDEVSSEEEVNVITSSKGSYKSLLKWYDDSSDEDIPEYYFVMPKASNLTVYTSSASKASNASKFLKFNPVKGLWDCFALSQSDTSYDETPSSDDATDENIAKFKVAAKSKGSISKPENVTSHKFVTQNVQTKPFPAKSSVPIRNYILGLAAAHTWACIGNETFELENKKDAIVTHQDRKGKKEGLNRKGSYSRLESRNMNISFTLGSAKEVDNLRILQSCNGLLFCSSLASPTFDYVNNPCTNLFKRLPQPENSHDDSHFHSFDGSNDPIDDIGSREFTIYEMIKGCYVWTVTYLVNTYEFMTPLFKRWSIQSTIWRIGLGEKKEDSFLVVNLSGKVEKYKLISKTISQIFDIRSNQTDDDDDYEFIPPYTVTHNLYEFISSIASV